MRLKLETPKLFADAIAIINELVTEVKIKINKDGLSITALDPASVALVDLHIPAKFFSEFDINGEEIIGVNLDDLKQVLKRLSKSSSLVIEKTDNLLHLKASDTGKRSFALALINVEAEEKKLPEFDFTSVIEMNADMLSEAIDDAAIVADSCSFETSDTAFIIEARGSLNKMRAEFSDEVSLLKAGNDKAKYSIEYLQKFMKATKIADKVRISFKTDHPLSLKFEQDGFALVFVLAPRMEEE